MSESMIDDGGSAFPLPITTTHECRAIETKSTGMTLRDYFAAKAMQAMLSNNEMINDTDNLSVNWITRSSFKIADAMIKARG